SVATAVPPVVAETVSVALFAPGAPVADGENTTPTVQTPFGCRVTPAQPLVLTTNSPALLPVSAAVSALVGAPPVLLIRNVFSGLEIPCDTGPKSHCIGVTCSAPGSTPMPDSDTEAVPPGVPPTRRIVVAPPALVGWNVTD